MCARYDCILNINILFHNCTILKLSYLKINNYCIHRYTHTCIYKTNTFYIGCAGNKDCKEGELCGPNGICVAGIIAH